MDAMWERLEAEEREHSDDVIEIEAPAFYPKQYEAIFSPARWVSIEASTKAGKTVGCIGWQAFHVVNRPAEHWWVAPVYGQAEIAFNRVKKFLPPEIYKANNQKMRLNIINGATWHFKSAQNTDNLYGEDVGSAVIDEASRCKDGTYPAIRSTLTATRGPCRMIGNVKGRKNWFYDQCRLAEQHMRDLGEKSNRAYYKLTAYDAVEGGVLAASEIEDARLSLPEHVFRELYLAEPSDDGSNPFGFKHIEDARTPTLSGRPVEAWGIDVASKTDWTVLVGLDRYGCTAAFYRFQEDWDVTARRIITIVGHDRGAMDATGPGGPLFDRIKKYCRNLEPYVFTQRSKQMLMENLATALAHGELAVLDGVMTDELMEFEYVSRSTGYLYSAPPGYHDDCVCALGLAEHSLRNRSTFVPEMGPRL